VSQRVLTALRTKSQSDPRFRGDWSILLCDAAQLENNETRICAASVGMALLLRECRMLPWQRGDPAAMQTACASAGAKVRSPLPHNIPALSTSS